MICPQCGCRLQWNDGAYCQACMRKEVCEVMPIDKSQCSHKNVLYRPVGGNAEGWIPRWVCGACDQEFIMKPTCTCDENCDDPCPEHCVENVKQDREIEAKKLMNN